MFKQSECQHTKEGEEAFLNAYAIIRMLMVVGNTFSERSPLARDLCLMTFGSHCVSIFGKDFHQSVTFCCYCQGL